MREAAVAALTELGNPEAFEALEPVLSTSDVDLRVALVEELADIDNPEATELLQRAAHDASPHVAGIAAEYLSERGAANDADRVPPSGD